MQMTEVIKSMNLFATKLYYSLSVVESDQNENIFFGPASVYAAMSMIYSGASDITAEELEEVMCLPKTGENFADAFFQLWNSMIKTNECLIEVANRIWIKEGSKIEDDYLTLVRERYLSDVAKINFFNAEAAAGEINKWIAAKTKGKIEGMMGPGNLSKDTTFVITSAMYFLGEWMNRFEIANTQKMPFHAPDGIINVDMMFRKGNFGYEEIMEYDCKVLVMKYRNSTLRFLIILPNKVDGVFSLAERLYTDHFEGKNIWDWISFNNREVHLYLPKFQICEKTDLKLPLQNLGLNRLFGHADLKGISKSTALSVSGISHGAYIDVNEKGTEVAVCTKSDLVVAGCTKYLEFKVGHPCLFMIVDIDVEVILFWGKLCKPSA